MKKYARSAVASMGLASTSLFAAVPATVTTALGDLAADMATVGGLLVAAAVVAVSFKWIKGAVFG